PVGISPLAPYEAPPSHARGTGGLAGSFAVRYVAGCDAALHTGDAMNEHHEGTGRIRMKRMGWLLFAAALFAANVGIAEEAPPVAPAETVVPPSSSAPAQDNVELVIPAPPVPPVTATPPPAPPVAPTPPSPSAPPSATPPPPAYPIRRQPAVAVVPPAGVPSPAMGGGAGFFVKFNNADIYEVIHTLGRAAGINYLIDPRVRGVVNVQTQGMVRKDGALDLLFSILKVNGATAIKEGDTYHIVPMTEAKTEPLLPSFQGDGPLKGPVNQVSMRAYPLQYIAVAEMAKVIKPFLTPGGEAVEVGRANILLVIDTTANLDKTARLVELFDSEVFRAAGMKLFKLKVLDPEEMAKNLENIFGALDFSARGGKPAGINFVPIPRLYSLLVVSASPKTMEDVEKWIGELDRTGGGASRSVYRYRVKYGKVKDIAAVLERLYPSRTASITEKKTEFKPAVSQLPGQASFPSQTPPAGQPGGAGVPAAARTTKGETEVSTQPFDIIPDEATNSLILRASLSEYADALEILKAVDVYPQQVLLEVLVGEVTLDDTLKLGIDWTFNNNFGQGGGYQGTGTLNQGNPLNNFSYLVEKTGKLTAAFRALANDGRASVLSSPSIIATNGKKSKINVVDQIPITTSVLNSATNPPVTTTTVEYRDVGVILSFTPFINDSGLVTLEIDQEVSDVNSTSGSTTTNPTFFKRSISTNLVASQDQSIVLGGLVKERKSLNRAGLPWLYKIPVIGWFFGSRDDTISRTELLIFITPRVIRSVEEGVQLSRDFEERVGQLKARMKETQGFRLKVQPVLPVPDPSSNIPPAKAPPK
ncbi:MAG TPA: type II secretion system secretin GspD, partial [Candidatus Deferrimicrobium sp.]